MYDRITEEEFCVLDNFKRNSVLGRDLPWGAVLAMV